MPTPPEYPGGAAAEADRRARALQHDWPRLSFEAALRLVLNADDRLATAYRELLAEQPPEFAA
ncbi:MAG: hypothetical protein AB7G10_24730 [Reyranellaceae bacterium]